ncbi:MAG TPA: Hpt domain-containing protein, partial [Albitalea sp.]|nr:Hpt domain-containing protein [Albitalea sp.]
MESSRNTEATGEIKDDLSALAWVQEELRRSLDAAHKALRRFVKEAEALTGSDVDAVDPSVLRTARAQIHQGVGALELVGLPAAATVLRACEAAVQRFVAKPHRLTSHVVDDLEHASFALLDYLARMLSGKVVSPLAMFPQYRAVQEAAGADRVHPADLWAVDWRWRDLPAGGTQVQPRQPDNATRSAMEQQMLVLMRGHNAAAASAMSDLCEGLAAGAQQGQAATLWKLAAAMFEAQAQDLLRPDVFTKRVASRLLAQLRIVERGEGDVSERLAQDLLFFCAQSQSPGDGRKAPRLAAVRQAYGLAHHTPVDYAVSSLGKFDPAWIVQARKRVAAAKESWSAVAGGEMHRMSGLSEQFSLVGDSLKRLFPQGEAMANELAQAVAMTQASASAPSAALAMEVATSLLYVEAALEDSDFDHVEQGERVRRMAERIAAVRQGAAPEPLEGWMEDLYRRVSDRQTMGSVVQELRASLSEAEKLIDQFFRNPADRNVLIPVPNQLAAMRGVLSVLGMDQAATALLRMRDDVDGLISTEVDSERVKQTGLFDRLAGNLGALGFLIDMLSVQPQMAKSLFTYDAADGTLSPVMGRSEQRESAHTAPAAAGVEPRLIEQAQMLAFSAVREDVPVEAVSRELERLSQEAQAADQHSLAATVSHAREALEQARGDADDIASVRGQLSEALVDFVNTASGPIPLDMAPVAAPAAAPAPAAGTSTDLAEDDEMREIFLEEAREVVQTANAACADLAGAPSDLGQLTTVRRAFHTLKGSSRMVGLKAFGDAAWACEQLYNTRLADQQPADDALLDFTRWSLEYLGGWVEDIAARRDGGRQAKVVEAKALALREPAAAPSAEAPLPEPEVIIEPQAMPELPQFEEPAAAAPVPAFEPISLALPTDLPSALDLELKPAAAPSQPAPAAQPAHELSFELDLSSFDAASEPVPAAAGLTPTAIPVPAPQPMVESAEVVEPMDLIDIDLGDATFSAAAPLIDLPSAAPAAPAPSAPAEDDQVKIVGPLRIGIPLFNIFLNEADELSRRLTTEVAEWAMELHRPVGETAIALAHSLAGSSATVGFSDLSQLSRTLEHALMRTETIGRGTEEEARLFVATAEEIRRLLHQFAAGFLKEPSPELLHQLADHEVSSARRLDAITAEAEVAAETAPETPEPIQPAAPIVETPAAVEAPAAVAPVDIAAVHPLPGGFVDSGFGQPDSRFGALGVAEFKPLSALPAGAHHVDAARES